MSRPYALRVASVVCGAVMFAPWPSVAQRLGLSSTRIDVTLDADSEGGGAHLLIGGTTAEAPFTPLTVAFRARLSTTILPPDGPRFLIVSPARGTAEPRFDPGFNGRSAANGAVTLDPSVVPFLPPGVYSGTFTYDVDVPNPPLGTGAGGFFNLTIRTPPPPAIAGVVNSASFRPVIAPGCVVSIFGTNLGSPAREAKFNEFGVYPTDFGNSTVTFNGSRLR